MKRLGTVMGAAALVAAVATGCGATGGSETKECPAGGSVTFELPDAEPATVARAAIVKSYQGSTITEENLSVGTDGKLIVSCKAGSAVTLVTW